MKLDKKHLTWIAIFLLIQVLSISLYFIRKEDQFKACELLTIALDESGDLAPAWYSNAGAAISKCGNVKAQLYGDYKACLANRRDDTSINCDKEEAAVFTN